MYYKSLLITETEGGKFARQIVERPIDQLPPGDVLIKVLYAGLNYKDGLSAIGHKGVTRSYPHTPGIEASGIVIKSDANHFHPGEEIFITGYDLGMNTHGSYSEYIRVPSDWIMRRPNNLTPKDCMTIGTAGFTAAFSLYKMQLLGQNPEYGPIVVTGSSGGVGSFAVAMLANAGYEVVAVTGKPDATEYLKFLGATRVESRDYVTDTSGKPLQCPQWAGAIDTVGGSTLATLLKRCQREGCVVATGLVGSAYIETSIYPLILNGVNLLGIGAGFTPMPLRLALWEKITHEWNVNDKLTAIAHEVNLEELKDTYIDAILAGKTQGRVVVKINEG